MKNCKRLISVIISIIIATGTSFTYYATNTLDSLNYAIKGAFSYKYAEFSADNTTDFLNILSKEAGEYSSDWYYIALSRYGISCNNTASINSLKSAVDTLYSDGLENCKATDMQRIALALLSCGCDITNINGHNLLADCSYNRDKYAPLDKQGVNSLAFGLIVLDSKNYSVPSNAKLSRQDIINKILDKELSAGGFSLIGNNADVDVTAIALQSLAPYKNQSKVKSVIERGLKVLSNAQQDTGTFKSFGKENAESTAQVILALTSLNINLKTDTRFIKSGNTVLDGLMSFNMNDGGFCHTKGYSSDNMATYQSLCALISYYRYLQGQGRFYDFTEKATKQQSTKLVPIHNYTPKKSIIKSNSKNSTTPHSSANSKTKNNSNIEKSENTTSTLKNSSNTKKLTETSTNSTTVANSKTSNLIENNPKNTNNNSNKEKSTDNTKSKGSNPLYITFSLLVCSYIILFFKRCKK